MLLIYFFNQNCDSITWGVALASGVSIPSGLLNLDGESELPSAGSESNTPPPPLFLPEVPPEGGGVSDRDEERVGVRQFTSSWLSTSSRMGSSRVSWKAPASTNLSAAATSSKVSNLSVGFSFSRGSFRCSVCASLSLWLL